MKDRYTSLQMSPGKSRRKENHISGDDCLKVTALFGSNSFGKSNLIKALKTLKKLVTDPYYSTRDPIASWNFKSDVTSFDIEFNYNGMQYLYHLAL